MRGSGLSSKERAQCLWNAGGVYDPEGHINVLRTTYSSIEDDDRRKGKIYPMKLRARKTFKKKIYRSTHQADTGSVQDEDEYDDPDG